MLGKVITNLCDGIHGVVLRDHPIHEPMTDLMASVMHSSLLNKHAVRHSVFVLTTQSTFSFDLPTQE